LDVTRRLELFLEVIAAVRHAHQKGIIHRDLKPTNILVADVDGRARPKVIDFGIARATEGISAEWTYRSHDGRIIGTPEYMSPEQASSNAALVDTRSDVYSLGVILYEILVGALPFDHRELRSSGLGALLRTIRDVEPPRPTTRLRSLPSEKIEEIAAARSSSIATLRRQLRGDLEHVVARALERDPDRRYPSVAELGADLERYLRGETVLATRPSFGYRVAKFARRHRAAVTLVAAITATLIASLVLAIRAYLEAEDARSELESTLALRDHDLRERWQALLRAERARQRSEALRWLAEARSIAPTRPEVALHLALRVAKIESGSHVNDSLLEVLSHFVPFEESRNEGGTVGLLYSPGGRFLAASSHTTATTVLLDATTLEEVRSFPGYSHRIALSPDGTLIATNDGRDAVSIFRVDTGERIAKTSRTSLVYDLTFDSTGARVIGALVGGDVRIWDARTGRMIRRIRAHEDRVYRAALSHDDRFLLTASRDGTARLYDLAASGEPRTLALGAQVDDVAFSPQGDLLAAVTASGRVIVEETETGRTIIDRVLGAGALRSVSFRPDGGAIVTGSQAGIVFIIEIDSGREISLRGHRDQVEHAEHSPDGTRVVTASFDKTAKLWDATTGEMLVELVGHEDRVQRAVFARDGRRVATVSFDGTVRTWALETVLAQRSYRHEDYAYSVGFSPDGRFVVSTSRDGTVRMARVDPFELARTMTHDARVYRARFDPSGELLVASRSDGSCHVSHMGSGERIATLAGHQGVVLGLAVDPRGRWVATASEDRTVRVWSLADGTELWRGEEEARVDVVAFDPDGTLVASGSRGGVTRLRDAASGVEIRSWADHERQVSALAFTPDGRYLITASTDHRVRVRDLRGDGEIRALDRHERGVLDLVVAPRGTFLVTASADESAIVWDLASAKPTLELRSHHSAVCAVAISPDEAWIATASHDGTAKLWDARTGALAASYP
ncbi:MAG TPA: protein kinase, partial [Planctomycetota bacterium]|nr:protein kinase [Planctomycetota bacterium]